MNNESPTLIAINHDNHHATHVGRTFDGKQFFVTTPFVPAIDGKIGQDYVALYLFNLEGSFLEAKIDALGTRSESTYKAAEQICARRIEEIGPVEYQRIEVQPFQIEHDGIIFGLVPYPPDEDSEDWWITAEPGDYIAFYEPWDSGEYDT